MRYQAEGVSRPGGSILQAAAIARQPRRREWWGWAVLALRRQRLTLVTIAHQLGLSRATVARLVCAGRSEPALQARTAATGRRTLRAGTARRAVASGYQETRANTAGVGHRISGQAHEIP